MQPISEVYLKMKQGFEGNLDISCYNYVGQLLSKRGRCFRDAVVAFYGLGAYYNHAAIETRDGQLVDERQAPHNFRGTDGRCQRIDMLRAVLPVPTVLALLQQSVIKR